MTDATPHLHGTPDLQGTYLGLPLRSPLIAGSSPLMRDLDNLRRLEDAGAGALVLHSLFAEEVQHETDAITHLLAHGTESTGEALSYFPAVSGPLHTGIDAYLQHLHHAREAVDIPVIASLNGVDLESWVSIAADLERAGAQALELNMYWIPTDPNLDAAAVEQRYLSVLEAVLAEVSLPVAVKMNPHFSAPAHIARRLVEAGASGLVLFNRFYQPDFNLETLEVEPCIEWSRAPEIRMSLLWLSILREPLSTVSLAASTGVQGPEEVVKLILAGADAVFTTSALLEHGVDHMETLVAGLTDWMRSKEYESVAQFRGAMRREAVAHPEVFERANYMRVLASYRDPGSS